MPVLKVFNSSLRYRYKPLAGNNGFNDSHPTSSSPSALFPRTIIKKASCKSLDRNQAASSMDPLEAFYEEGNNYFIFITQGNDADTIASVLFPAVMINFSRLKQKRSPAPIIILCPPKEHVLLAHAQTLENFSKICKNAQISVKIVYAEEDQKDCIADHITNSIMMDSRRIPLSSQKNPSLNIFYLDFPSSRYHSSVDQTAGKVAKQLKEELNKLIVRLIIFDHHDVDESTTIEERKQAIKPDEFVNIDDPEEPSCINLLLKTFGHQTVKDTLGLGTENNNSELAQIREQIVDISKQALLTDLNARLLLPAMFANIEECISEYPIISEFFGKEFEPLYKIIQALNHEIIQLATHTSPQQFAFNRYGLPIKDDVLDIHEISKENYNNDALKWLNQLLQEKNLEHFIPNLLSDDYKRIQEPTLKELVLRLKQKYPQLKVNSLLLNLLSAKLRILYTYINKKAKEIYEKNDQASIPAMNLAANFAAFKGGKTDFEKFLKQLDETFLKLNLSQIIKNPLQAQIYGKLLTELSIPALEEALMKEFFENLIEKEEEIFSSFMSEVVWEVVDSPSLLNPETILAAFAKDGFTTQLAEIALKLGVTQTEVWRHILGALRQYFGKEAFLAMLPLDHEIMIGANFPVNKQNSLKENIRLNKEEINNAGLCQGLTFQRWTNSLELVKKSFVAQLDKIKWEKIKQYVQNFLNHYLKSKKIVAQNSEQNSQTLTASKVKEILTKLGADVGTAGTRVAGRIMKPSSLTYEQIIESVKTVLSQKTEE